MVKPKTIDDDGLEAWLNDDHYEDERYICRFFNGLYYELSDNTYKDKEFAQINAHFERRTNNKLARVAKLPDGNWGIYTREKEQ
ncbi:MAG: hypothetical protein CMB80_08045 [Flammeovirgaceae bacterium]|nr:hypothetical protein [Flammeovirgaceae bacterium]|tara:strand:+ start:909 stop:1160 length:252 start_codon:yes stop_codon:yes gene_type:complete